MYFFFSILAIVALTAAQTPTPTPTAVVESSANVTVGVVLNGTQTAAQWFANLSALLNVSTARLKVKGTTNVSTTNGTSTTVNTSVFLFEFELLSSNNTIGVPNVTE